MNKKICAMAAFAYDDGRFINSASIVHQEPINDGSTFVDNSEYDCLEALKGSLSGLVGHDRHDTMLVKMFDDCSFEICTSDCGGYDCCFLPAKELLEWIEVVKSAMVKE